MLQGFLQGGGSNGAHAVLIRRGYVGQGRAVLAQQPAKPGQQGDAPGSHAGGLPPAVEQFFELFAVQTHPFATEADEAVLAGQQFLQLSLSEGVVAQYHAGAEAQQGGDIQRGGAVGFLAFAAGLQLHLQLHARRAALPEVHHAGFDTGLLQHRQTFQKIVCLPRPPGAGFVDIPAVDELVQEGMLSRSLLQRPQQGGQGACIAGIQLAGQRQRRVARLAILPGAVNEGGQKGKRMRLCPLAAILCQVEAQGAQLLPALAQPFQPLFGGGELALRLPGQCRPQGRKPLAEHPGGDAAAIDRRHALQPGGGLLR